MKRLENHRGVALYVDPLMVHAISESMVDGCTAIATKTGDKFTANGDPDAVHAAIFGTAPAKDGEDVYLSVKVVVAALTHEYRITLGMESNAAAHQIRVAIRSAAEAMGVRLDEVLINAPLPETG